jgi:hypothetical protein
VKALSHYIQRNVLIEIWTINYRFYNKVASAREEGEMRTKNEAYANKMNINGKKNEEHKNE